MEPFTVSALATTITTLLNSTADEAGKSLWKKLSATISRRFGDSSSEAVAIAQVDEAAASSSDEDLPAAAAQAASLLVVLAQRDKSIADLLGNLTAVVDSTTVTNTVSGTVSGPVIQTHTIHGGITFN